MLICSEKNQICTGIVPEIMAEKRSRGQPRYNDFDQKNFDLDFFLKNAPTCSQGSTVYQKNKNNSVEGFVVGKNGQKCQRFSLLGQLLKFIVSVDQYLMHVNLRIFISFLDF